MAKAFYIIGVESASCAAIGGGLESSSAVTRPLRRLDDDVGGSEAGRDGECIAAGRQTNADLVRPGNCAVDGRHVDGASVPECDGDGGRRSGGQALVVIGPH